MIDILDCAIKITNTVDNMEETTRIILWPIQQLTIWSNIGQFSVLKKTEKNKFNTSIIKGTLGSHKTNI